MGCGSSKPIATAQLDGKQRAPQLNSSDTSLAEQRIAQKHDYEGSGNLKPGDALDTRPPTAVPAPAAGTAQQVTPSPAATAARGQATNVMQQVKVILQKLSQIEHKGSFTSLEAAANVLLQQLGFVDMVSLQVCRSTSDVVLLGGAAGVGGDRVKQQPISKDTSQAAAICFKQGSGSPYLYMKITSEDNLPSLPSDWLLLHQENGLSAFLAAAVQGVDGFVGVVTLASKQPSAFRDAWFEPLFSMVSSGLVAFLGHPLMSGLCGLADRLINQDFQDYKAVARLFIETTSEVLEAVTHSSYSVRLGVLSADHQSTLVLHLTGDQPGRIGQGSCISAESSSIFASVRFCASETILLEAVRSQGPRLIPDTRKYTEGHVQPSVDILLKNQPLISSLVVVPFTRPQDCDTATTTTAPSSGCCAGLYVASREATDFSSCKSAITSIASLGQWLLAPHLQEGGLLAAACEQQHTALQPSSSRHSSPQRGEPGPDASTSGAGSSLGSRNTSALMQLLQQQLRVSLEKSKRRSAVRGAVHYIEDIQLLGVLGVGGFGTVYKGAWKGSPAAIKVMSVPKQQRQVMKSAMEMAVLESLSHPNIVCTYSIFTDLVQEYVAGTGDNSSSSDHMVMMQQKPTSLKFRQYGELDDEDASQQTCNVVVMELCDCGSLHTAIKKGLLHQAAADGRFRLNMRRLLLILLDVARSLQYIHGRSLIHCDLKPANILLKSDANSPLGYCCKLADFGLVKWLSENQAYLKNKSLSGTITHVAPERYKTGTRITAAVDIYAFGMIMYEAYTRKQPFENLRPAEMVTAVFQGKRPEYGPGVPDQYRLLTEACWARDPGERPTADVVVVKLQEMMTGFSRGPSDKQQSQNTSV